jgi:hypothetical protein
MLIEKSRFRGLEMMSMHSPACKQNCTKATQASASIEPRPRAPDFSPRYGIRFRGTIAIQVYWAGEELKKLVASFHFQ